MENEITTQQHKESLTMKQQNVDNHMEQSLHGVKISAR